LRAADPGEKIAGRHHALGRISMGCRALWRVLPGPPRSLSLAGVAALVLGATLAAALLDRADEVLE